MENQIVKYEDIERMGSAITKSGLFGVKTQEQAVALMLIAQAEGLHPAIAARDYHIIQGRPSMKTDAMLARFQMAGGTVAWGEYTDTSVTATFSHPSGGKVTLSWTIENAKRAGLMSNPTWTKYPRQMLRARVISEGIRTVYPGSVVGMYTPEEISDLPPEPGAGPAGSGTAGVGPIPTTSEVIETKINPEPVPIRRRGRPATTEPAAPTPDPAPSPMQTAPAAGNVELF